MTSTEKAQELFTKMNGFRISYAHRVKCAKIVVDEIDIILQKNNDDPYGNMESLQYWQDVKSELDKLGVKK